MEQDGIIEASPEPIGVNGLSVMAEYV